MSLIYGGSYPWMSPELLDFEACEHKPTKESDIYALGMLIYEVRTRSLLRKNTQQGGDRFYAGTVRFVTSRIRL